MRRGKGGSRGCGLDEHFAVFAEVLEGDVGEVVVEFKARGVKGGWGEGREAGHCGGGVAGCGSWKGLGVLFGG